MKTKILLSVLIFSVTILSSPAQWINSITMSPAVPTELDTIYFYANVDFPSGGCNDKMMSSGVSLPYLYGGALHCLGPLAFICNDIDTFKFDPLPPGSYTFIYQVDAGGGPSPCTPGIVPGPSDSVGFTVFPVVNINETGLDNSFQLFPNPATDFTILILKNNSTENQKLKILGLNGRLVKELAVRKNMKIDTSDLENGIYLIQLFENNSLLGNSKLIIKR